MPWVEISVAPGEIAKVADYTLVPAFTNCSIYLSFSPTMDFPGQQLYRPFYVSLRGILINSFLVLPTACQAKWSRRFHRGGALSSEIRTKILDKPFPSLMAVYLTLQCFLDTTRLGGGVVCRITFEQTSRVLGQF